MAKQSIILLLGILITVSLVVADDPPNLINHQFYGDVQWDKDSIAPQKVAAKIGDKTVVSVIKSSPCLEELCTGSYGYEPGNILRVQGQEGEKIKFLIDEIEVKEYIYKAGAITKLDFDLTLKIEENIPVDNKVNESVNLSVEVNAPPENISKEIPKKEPAEQLSEVPAEEPVTSPPQPAFKASDFKPPQLPEEKPAVDIKKEEAKPGLSSKYYIFAGVALIVIATIVIIFLVKRGRASGGITLPDAEYPPR